MLIPKKRLQEIIAEEVKFSLEENKKKHLERLYENIGQALEVIEARDPNISKNPKFVKLKKLIQGGEQE